MMGCHLDGDGFGMMLSVDELEGHDEGYDHRMLPAVALPLAIRPVLVSRFAMAVTSKVTMVVVVVVAVAADKTAVQCTVRTFRWSGGAALVVTAWWC